MLYTPKHENKPFSVFYANQPILEPIHQTHAKQNSPQKGDKSHEVAKNGQQMTLGVSRLTPRGITVRIGEMKEYKHCSS